MKRIIIGALAMAAITFAACNNSSTPSHEDHEHDNSAIAGEAMQQEAAAVKPQFTNVDPATAASLKLVVDHYLHIKNALAGDNADEAANGGKAMAAAMEKVDKAVMTPEQQQLYTENEDDLKEHAEHISKNGSNIKHQREHFAQMSEDVYALVKAFGGGQALYHDHCPMYDNNKGALWLSESKEIKNPYFGSEMATCGAVKEVIAPSAL